MHTSLHLLPPLGETIDLIGDPVRGAGWYGHTNGLHTVMMRVMNFQGRISLEASIITEPGDDDWYTVLPDKAAYIQFPRPGFIVQPPNYGETSVTGFNFTTNAVWLRASVSRDYLIPSSNPWQIMEYGTVAYVMVNY